MPMTLTQELEALVTRMYRGNITLHEGVREFKRHFIQQVLEDCHWNQCKAAPILGMHRNTLSRTIAELKIERPEMVKKKPQPSRLELAHRRWGRLAS